MIYFVDTNVFVYARDSAELVKQPLARAWIGYLWASRSGRLSVQVLNEYYVTVTRKLTPGLPAASAQSDVRDLGAWSPVSLSPQVVERAWEVEGRFGLSFWDSLIVAAAVVSGADCLLSEDLQTGQILDGVQVVNPFATPPPAAVDFP